MPIARLAAVPGRPIFFDAVGGRHRGLQEAGCRRLEILILNNRRSDEDSEVRFFTSLHVVTEEKSNTREIAEDRHFGVLVVDVVFDKAAHDQGVSAWDEDRGLQFTFEE